MRLFKQACFGNDPVGCTSYGEMLETGRGTSKDIVKASNLYYDSCRMGEFIACVNLGTLYEVGAESPVDGSLVRDDARAHWYYEAADEISFRKALLPGAILRIAYHGNRELAAGEADPIWRVLDDECHSGHAKYCGFKGVVLIATGQKDLGNQTLRMGCEGGDPWSCFEWKRLAANCTSETHFEPEQGCVPGAPAVLSQAPIAPTNPSQSIASTPPSPATVAHAKSESGSASEVNPSGAESRSPATGAWIVGGIGATGLIVGTISGVLALKKASTLSSECPRGYANCPATAQSDINRLHTQELVADISLGVGLGGAVITGIILLTSGHKETTTAPTVTGWLGPRSVGIGGTF